MQPEIKIPTLLRELNNWNRWRLAQNKQGKWTKVPDESTRNRGRSFDATAGPSTANEGRGFVFTGGIDVPAGRVMAIDLDACRDPVAGTIEPWATHLLNVFGRSYTEVTPSGCGLRVWFICENPPSAREFARVKVKVAKDRAPNVPEGKSVEWQLFGYGVPQFVTVTGKHLLSTSPELRSVRDLDALDREGQILRRGPTRVDANALPAGEGPMPSLDAVEHRIEALAEPMRSAILDANWRPLLTDDERDVSASAAFYRVVQNVLRAAHGHGTGALAFLLSRTAWGRGEVEESADPSRYARESWVANEITRIGAKTTTPTGALFDDGLKVENWTPPVAAVPAPKGRLFDPFELEGLIGEVGFLVDQFLPQVGLARFFGDPGCGKSTVAAGLAVHIVGGLPTWCNKPLPRGGGRVVYISGEGTPGLLARLRAAARHYSVDDAALRARLRVSRASGVLDDPRDVDAWCKEIAAFVAEEVSGPPLLAVFVDTQARNSAGDENSAQDAGRLVQGLQKIADTFGVLVVAVHHTGHGAKTRARGSMAVVGALDVELRVTKPRPGVVRIECTKAKDFEQPAGVSGRLIGGLAGRGSQTAALFVHDADLFRDDVLDFLAANPKASLQEIGNKICGDSDVPAKRKSHARRLVAKLTAEGKLAPKVRGKGWTVTGFGAENDDGTE